jgi:hypothetical protein
MHSLVSLGFGVAVLVLAPISAMADGSSARATVEEILDGPELYIDRAQARVKQSAQAPQTLSTGRSRGQIGFSTGATGRMNRDAFLQLGQRCFLLNRGEVLVSGGQAACTRSTRLSVRGTNYILGLNAAEETDVTVLEGNLELELWRGEQNLADPINRVSAGQRLQISSTGEVLTLSLLSLDEVAAILRGPLFQGFQTPLADQAGLDRHLRQHYPSLVSPATPEGQMRTLLKQIREINASLDAKGVPAPPPSTPSGSEQPPADPRLSAWQRDHERNPSPATCWSQVQDYYSSIARTYRDWQAPKPSRKGRFTTRIDFEVSTSSTPGSARASNFLITRRSGEELQDRSAFAEARRKSRELPPPPACVGPSLRVYHQFIVDYV